MDIIDESHLGINVDKILAKHPFASLSSELTFD